MGFPILIGRPKRNGFYFIIEKMKIRLASWKNKLLNRSGRLALTTFVLSFIVYFIFRWIGFLKTYVIALCPYETTSLYGDDCRFMNTMMIPCWLWLVELYGCKFLMMQMVNFGEDIIWWCELYKNLVIYALSGLYMESMHS